MNKWYAGFSLIELMFYCMCLTILALIWSRLLLNTHGTMSRYSTQCTQLAELYGAYDVCVRDVRNAAGSKAWHMATNGKLIWQQSDTMWIGLLFEDKKLLRYEGNYDSKKNSWDAHKKSLVADGLSMASFAHGSNSVTIRLGMGSYTIEREVFLYA